MRPKKPKKAATKNESIEDSFLEVQGRKECLYKGVQAYNKTKYPDYSRILDPNLKNMKSITMSVDINNPDNNSLEKKSKFK